MASNSEIINSVKKAAYLLEIMSQHNPIGVREMARLTNIDKSTVSRILRTLEEASLVTRSSVTGKFMISIKLWEMANRSLANSEIKEMTDRHLRRLSKQINETVLIGVLLDNDILYIQKLRAPNRNGSDGESNIEISSDIGYRVPLYNSASGKAWLAFTTPENRRKLLNSIVFKKTSKNTIDSMEVLKKDLEVTAKRGYSVNNEELREGIRAIAAPIYNSRGEVISVLTLTAQATRMNPVRIAELGNILVQYSKKMSLDFGYQDCNDISN